MAAALTEAIRVLRPTGSLYVAEPVPEGPFHQVVRSFHDESRVQAAARDALRATATPRFRKEQRYRYVSHHRYRDFADFVDDMTAKDYNDYSRADIDNDAVRRAFEACADSAGYILRHPVRVNLFSHPQSP
jgi:ubiquinone/menaquinone biosynthesis C-methylase UbiE